MWITLQKQAETPAIKDSLDADIDTRAQQDHTGLK